jgi:hypothetical protein
MMQFKTKEHEKRFLEYVSNEKKTKPSKRFSVLLPGGMANRLAFLE